MTVAIVVVRVIRRYTQYYTYLLLKSTNNEGSCSQIWGGCRFNIESRDYDGLICLKDYYFLPFLAEERMLTVLFSVVWFVGIFWTFLSTVS